MKSVVLVSCVSMKNKTRSPAKDLYISPWFKSARRLAEDTGVPWYILSAKYELLHIDETISYYNKTLSASGPKEFRMNAAERRAWAKKVQRQIQEELPSIDKVIFLAGARYREHLVPWLESRGVEVCAPLKHIQGLGPQANWMNDRKTL